jgi:hypothetical protein
MTKWHQMPVDAGQIVSVTYSVDWAVNKLYRRTHDRSDNSVEIEAAKITSGEFEPWNCILPRHRKWRKATAEA